MSNSRRSTAFAIDGLAGFRKAGQQHGDGALAEALLAFDGRHRRTALVRNWPCGISFQ